MNYERIWGEDHKNLYSLIKQNIFLLCWERGGERREGGETRRKIWMPVMTMAMPGSKLRAWQIPLCISLQTSTTSQHSVRTLAWGQLCCFFLFFLTFLLINIYHFGTIKLQVVIKYRVRSGRERERGCYGNDRVLALCLLYKWNTITWHANSLCSIWLTARPSSVRITGWLTNRLTQKLL